MIMLFFLVCLPEMELDAQERTKEVLYSTLQTRKLLKSASGMVLETTCSQGKIITADTLCPQRNCLVVRLPLFQDPTKLWKDIFFALPPPHPAATLQ